MQNKNNGCCKNGGRCEGCCCHNNAVLSSEEKQFLSLLAETPFLPVAKFLLKSRKAKNIESIALAPVYLVSKNDSVDAVKKTGQIINQMVEHDIISLDYDIPLENCDYSRYVHSDVFTKLKETVAEGQTNPEFIFDVTAIQFGSMALTGAGQAALEQI